MTRNGPYSGFFGQNRQKRQICAPCPLKPRLRMTVFVTFRRFVTREGCRKDATSLEEVRSDGFRMPSESRSESEGPGRALKADQDRQGRQAKRRRRRRRALAVTADDGRVREPFVRDDSVGPGSRGQSVLGQPAGVGSRKNVERGGWQSLHL